MISARQLSKTYSGRAAVRGLTLDVSGELYGFLGPNGAGKTTTIKMMTGLLTPTAGSVSLNGIDLRRDPVAAKSQFSLVPEQPALYEKLTATEFVDFYASAHRIPHRDAGRRTAQLFEIFEIRGIADDLIESYSQGTKQKVALSAALVHQPPILFLDEPTAGLDPVAARNLKDLLAGLVRKGTTIFMSTHILEVAEKLCDRIGIIKEGELVAEGSLQELRQRSERESGSLEEVFLQLTGTAPDRNVSAYLQEDESC